MNLLKFILSKWFWINIGVAILALIIGSFVVTTILGKITMHGKTISVPDLKTYSIEEVEEALSELSLRYKVVDSSAYTIKFPKNSVVKQEPRAGQKVKAGRMIYLTVNPSGYRVIQVPNLKGKTSRQAISYLKAVGLKVGKFEYRSDIGKNVVLGIKHKGKKIRLPYSLPKQSTIDLILGTGRGSKKVFLPNILGENLEKAKNKLRDASLNIGRIYKDTKNSDLSYYTVYKQEPKYSDNVSLNMGTSVKLWVTKDSSKIPLEDIDEDLE